LPALLWEQAVAYAVYLQNRTAHKGLKWKSPISRFEGSENNSHFRYARTFGCDAWAYNTKAQKLSQDKARRGVFLGMDEHRKAYLVYDPEKRVIFSTIHVKFNEGSFPMKKESLWNNPLFNPAGYEPKKPLFPSKVSGALNMDTDKVRIPNSFVPPSPHVFSTPSKKKKNANQVDKTDIVNPVVDITTDTGDPVVYREPDDRPIMDVLPDKSPVRRSNASVTSVSLPPTRPVAPAVPARRSTRIRGPSLAAQEAAQTNKQKAIRELQDEKSFALKSKSDKEILIEAHIHVDQYTPVPRSLKECQKSKYASLWQLAMDREIEGLQANNTWEEVPYVPNRKILSGHWVYDIKRNSSNSVKYFKARWVAHGNKQIEGTDYNETFAATSQMRTARILICLSVLYGCPITHADISNAFTNGILEEEIYMMHPGGMARTPGKVLKLIKSIYGLKQASRVWSLCLRDALFGIGFVQAQSDTCLYHHPDHLCFISIHVDDLLILTDDEEFRALVMEGLRKHFRLTDLGIVSQYLGMNVSFDLDGSARIKQDSYIKRMVQRFNVQDAKIPRTPLPSSIQLSKDDCPKTDEQKTEMEKIPYRGIIGSLLYAGRGAHPEIAQAVSALSRFCQYPGKVHWTYAKRVLCFLKGVMNKGLHYTSSSIEDGVDIAIYTDSDWGSNPDDRKSISGFVVTINGNPVSWCSRTQKSTALSSCEAEFLALSEAVREALWLWNLFEELNVGFVKPITIHVDNQSAIKLAENAVSHQRSKHIDIRYFRVREEVANGKIKLLYVPTQENIADIMTKSTSFAVFQKLVVKLIS
jgi:hypothetical protein